MNKQEIYELVKESLLKKEDWYWTQNYHTYKKNTGIPYKITNDKIGITIWIANGWENLEMKTKMKLNVKEIPLSITPEKKLPINLFKKYKLYKLIHKLFKETKFDIDIDEQLERDIKLKKLLK